MEETREEWGSKLGFILAAAGSAIGLGNIWRFPYMTGENGGAAFVLVYIFFVIFIGFTIMLAELTIGRHSQRNAVGAFEAIFPKTKWKWIGILGILTGVGILSFYSVVAGWTLGYFFKTVLGDFSGLSGAGATKEIFAHFISNPVANIAYLFVFIGLTVFVVSGGISEGIERWTKILMPLLFLILILLMIRSVTLGKGVEAGLSFYLKPDFSALNAEILIRALGQALFSLSLGMGAMITYGSYISKEHNLVTSAGYVVFFDTLIALLAGLVIFPALFAMGMNPKGGPGLVFMVLPSIFDKMPGGMLFGAGFFILLAIAALTSTISLLEVAVAYFIDERKWSRTKAAILTGFVAFLLGIPSALSQGASRWFDHLPLVHMPFLDFMNALFGNYALTVGSFFISIFVGWKWGIAAAEKEIAKGAEKFRLKTVWAFSIRFFAPVAIFLIFIYLIWTGRFF